MKRFINLSTAVLFVLTLTGFVFAQEKPVIPQVPKEVPQPTPPVDKTDDEDTAESEGEDYEVPFITKENLKDGKAELSAEIEELNAEAFVEANQDCTTQLRISFSNVNKIAKDKMFFIWLATVEGKYSKIGEVSYEEKSETAEIKGTVPIDNFGLLITVEDEMVEKPTSKTYVAFKQKAAE